MDTGNAIDVATPEGEIKTKALFDAMGRMGYQAAGIGERDLDRSWESLDAIRKRAAFPMLAANVRLQKSGQRLLDPYTIVTFDPKKWAAMRGKPLRVGVTSVIRYNPTFLKPGPGGDNIVVTSPGEELKTLIPEMRKKADFVVVLGSMPKDSARMLARDVPGIDVILSAYGGMVTMGDEIEGTTRMLYLGNQGKNLGEIRALPIPNGWQTTQTLHYLSSTYPEDPKMKEAVLSALGEINETNRQAAQARAQAPRPATGAAAAASGDRPTYAGSETCRDCHAEEWGIWKESRHAHAFDIMVARKVDYNPECVVCHVTGFRSRSGFEDATNTPGLVHVQCEACHGPASAHLRDPSIPYGRTSGDTMCRTCHTGENSPGYSFDVYWPKVSHGKGS